MDGWSDIIDSETEDKGSFFDRPSNFSTTCQHPFITMNFREKRQPGIGFEITGTPVCGICNKRVTL